MPGGLLGIFCCHNPAPQFGARHKSMLVFFNNLNFKIIEIQNFNKIILRKAHFRKSLKILDVGIQPYWRWQIKFMTDIVQSVKYFLCAAVFGIIAYYSTF